MTSSSQFSFLFAHDLFGKPPRTFPGHADHEHMAINVTCRHSDEITDPLLLSQECFELGKQRVLAVEHVVQRSDRYGFGTARAQEAAERIKLRRWAVQRDHSGRGRAAERRHHAEAVVRLSQHRGVATGAIYVMFGLGSTFGVSIATLLLTAGFRYYGGEGAGAPSPENAAVFVKAMNLCFFGSCITSAAAMLCSLMRGESSRIGAVSHARPESVRSN